MPYPETHPWIRFQVNMKDAPARLWIALGEARSKCEHLAGVPLKPEIAQKLHEIYLAKGALATTAIEGNTLNEAEALAIVQDKSQLPRSQAYLEREIRNVLEAANDVLADAERDGAKKITPQQIKLFNYRILKDLPVDEHVTPGEYAKTDLTVAKYRAPNWQEFEILVQRLCDWLNGPEFEAPEEDAVVYGIVKAIIAHVYLVWIHPFGDGNGRTARLLEVRLLTEAGIPSSASQLLSNFYNRTRNEYYRQLSDASRNGGNLTNFLVYAVTGFVDQLREQLKIVKVHQWHVSWENFVYERFRDRLGIADKRQRQLVLALSTQDRAIPKHELRRLTPELAEAYAGKTDKTVSRDIKELQKMKLVLMEKEGFRAASGQILAFLPRARKGGIEAQLKAFAQGDGQLSLGI